MSGATKHLLQNLVCLKCINFIFWDMRHFLIVNDLHDFLIRCKSLQLTNSVTFYLVFSFWHSQVCLFFTLQLSKISNIYFKKHCHYYHVPLLQYVAFTLHFWLSAQKLQRAPFILERSRTQARTYVLNSTVNFFLQSWLWWSTMEGFKKGEELQQRWI